MLADVRLATCDVHVEDADVHLLRAIRTAGMDQHPIQRVCLCAVDRQVVRQPDVDHALREPALVLWRLPLGRILARFIEPIEFRRRQGQVVQVAGTR